MEHLQNSILVHRLKEGDARAFDELYLKYFKLLCASAYFILKSENEAKDIVQGFFLDILEKRLFLSWQEDIKGYLFVSIRNRCLNRLKSQRVHEARKDGYSKLQDDHQHPDTGEEGGVHLQQLETIMESLRGQKKVALEMVYVHEKKYKEAASEMGISVNSFKTHLKGAIKALREHGQQLR